MLGSFQFQAPQIRLLPFPTNPDSQVLNSIADLVEKLIGVGNGDESNPDVMNRLNDLVYQLYGLSRDDIAKVEARETS